MADFGYKNNAVRKQEVFEPITNGNVADNCTIALTDKPLLC